MKKSFLLSLSFAAMATYAVNAQADNDDTNVATHQLDVNVPEVALLDIYDNNTSQEAGVIAFNMNNVSSVATNNAEAGLYRFEEIDYQNLWLNYTSVVGPGFDTERQINVRMEATSTFPGSLDLRITPEPPVVVANGGTANSAGSITAGGVALGVSTPIGSDALLVNSIESVYTGDQTQGVKLTYSLEQNGNFAGYQAGSYSASIRYTLSDL